MWGRDKRATLIAIFSLRGEKMVEQPAAASVARVCFAKTGSAVLVFAYRRRRSASESRAASITSLKDQEKMPKT